MVITGIEFDSEAFLAHLGRVATIATLESSSRIGAMWSAAIATGDAKVQEDFLSAMRSSLDQTRLYEIVLQSYLFLGFPRMLTAAETLAECYPDVVRHDEPNAISEAESLKWHSEGQSLCRKVYGSAFDRLQERVLSIAPEIYRWMIIEGYGKVLSRPGLSHVDRELCIVSSLMVDYREQQLYSHIRGALNVGASPDLVRTVIDDIGHGAPSGAELAVAILTRLGAG